MIPNTRWKVGEPRAYVNEGWQVGVYCAEDKRPEAMVANIYGPTREIALSRARLIVGAEAIAARDALKAAT